MLHSRLVRVSEVIKEALGPILDQEISDPRVPEFVTVNAVKVSSDLRSAVVLVTFLGDESEDAIREAMAGLRDSAGYIRTLLGRRIVLRYLPELHFEYNPSTRYALNLERVFHAIEAEPPPPVAPGTPPLAAHSPADGEGAPEGSR